MSARHLTNLIIIVKVRKGKVYSHYTSTFAVLYFGDNMEENLKDVVGYEGLYKISENGDVYSLHKKGFNGLYKMKQEIDLFGYYRVALCKNGKHTKKRVSRLVAEAFIPNPNNKTIVNHIDYNRKNNNVKNLEWCTQKENVIHSTSSGRYNNNRAKPVFCIDESGKIKKYPSMLEASRNTGAKNIIRAFNSKSKKSANHLWFRTEREALLWKMK